MESKENKGVTNMSTTAQKIAKKYNIVNGTELEFSEDNKCIILKSISKEPTLKELMAGITKENQHEEIDWGKPKGEEIW